MAQTVVPHIAVNDGVAAMDFYKRALGAQELSRFPAQDGKRLMHAEIKIGDSVIMLADEFPEMGGSCASPVTLKGTTFTLQVVVPDCDAAFAQATGAGATTVMPPADMFWGDRYSMVKDPFGHVWALLTHKEQLSNEEIQKRAKEFFASEKGVKA